jgi:hypothetical protein
MLHRTSLLAFVLLASVPAIHLAGQSSRGGTDKAVPHTPDGRADLQGMWTKTTAVVSSFRAFVADASGPKWSVMICNVKGSN